MTEKSKKLKRFPRLKDLRIGVRLGVSFGLVLLLMIGIVAVGLIQTRAANQITHRIVTEDWGKSFTLNEVIDIANDNIKGNLELFLLADMTQIEKVLERLANNEEIISEKLERLEKSFAGKAEAKEIFLKIQDARAEYLASFAEASGLVMEGGKREEAARVMLQKTLPALGTYIRVVKEVSKLQGKIMEAAEIGAEETYQAGRKWMLSLSLVILIVATLLALWITRSITRPLRHAVDAARQIAQGDMSARIEVTSGDEAGQLLMTMQDMVHSLNEMATVAQQLAQGDLSVQVKARSDKDVLCQSFQHLQQTMQSLIAETHQLVQWAREGKLERRGDFSKFQGGYRDLIQEFNGALDAIVTPINEAAIIMEKMAQRDLACRMQGEYQGDFARIKQALNLAMDNLEEGFLQVAGAVKQVNSTSGRITNGSQTLAQSAAEQATELKGVSASLQEVFSMTRQNAASSHNALDLSQNTRETVNKGVKSMQRLSAAIDQIKASADATAKIVKTIDEIAFQTNLLALNAAVEAARAGDAGKGFAVVAEEVRNLAMRSAEAARHTTNLIEESVKNAEGGVQLNTEVLLNLEQINRQVVQVSEVISEVATASEQQRQGVDHVLTAVAQMDRLTQQATINSQDSAAATEELLGQAEEMLSMVANFHLSQGTEILPARHARGRESRHLAGNGTPRAQTTPSNLRGKALPGKPSRSRVSFAEDMDGAVLTEF